MVKFMNIIVYIQQLFFNTLDKETGNETKKKKKLYSKSKNKCKANRSGKIHKYQFLQCLRVKKMRKHKFLHMQKMLLLVFMKHDRWRSRKEQNLFKD